jgi:membrane fusion protein (multidrug efflux system)
MSTCTAPRIADGGVQVDTAPVRLRLSDGTDYPLPGTLEFADVDVQQETGSITLRARFPQPGWAAAAGHVRARAGGAGYPPAGTAGATGRGRSQPQGRGQAWLVDKDGKARLRLFRTARAVGDQWLVLDGLAAGEQVVVAARRAWPMA